MSLHTCTWKWKRITMHILWYFQSEILEILYIYVKDFDLPEEQVFKLLELFKVFCLTSLNAAKFYKVTWKLYMLVPVTLLFYFCAQRHGFGRLQNYKHVIDDSLIFLVKRIGFVIYFLPELYSIWLLFNNWQFIYSHSASDT